MQVVSALFDINPSMNTHMAMPLWKRCVGTLLEVRNLCLHGAQCLPACCTCGFGVVLFLPVQHALPWNVPLPCSIVARQRITS